MGLRDGFNYMDGGIENRFQQQYLCIEPTDRQKNTEHTVGNEMIGEQNYHFYTAESLFPKNRLPWSPQLLWIFHKTYGVPLKNNLKCLFFDVDEYRRIRYCYWKLVRDLFSDSFMKPFGEKTQNFTEKVVDASLLLLDTAESEWLHLTHKISNEVTKLRRKKEKVMNMFTSAHIHYRLCDDRILRRYATVEADRVIIGRKKYSKVIVPPCDCLGDITCNLLEVFKREGGKIVFVERVPKFLAGFESDRFEKIAEGCEVVFLDRLISSL